jgi:chemotaxis protein MotB
MPRRRRKREEERPNHERWLVSYADFITLLFAFFVVMYAISSVNEGKYRVLSETLTDAFKEPSRSSDPIQVGELSRSSGVLPGGESGETPIETKDRGSRQPADAPLKPTPGNAEGAQAPDAAQEAAARRRLDRLAGALSTALQPYLADHTLTVVSHGRWIEVSMKSGVLFGSGDASLSPAAVGILRDVSRVLMGVANPIQVDGYTDNVPISTEAFPSNWELSAARAASVVHLFTRLGLDPQRLAAVGYGEYRPVADNATEEGRRQNRRITLVIAAERGPGGGADRAARGGRG